VSRRLLSGLVIALILTIIGAGASVAAPPAQRATQAEADHAVGDGVVDTAVEDDAAHHGQHGGPGGHLPATQENVELVGKLRVSDAVPGRIADVTAFGNYAYLAAFSEPECQRGGVYVVDISDPAHSKEVGFIPTAEDSFVGEGMQVLHIESAAFTGDVLAFNNEICGDSPEAVGGMSLWDVTDPLHPQPLALGVGDTTIDGEQQPRANQIHSVRIWQQGDRYFAVLVDDEELADVDIFEITDPRNPVLLVETGLGDWPDAQAPLARGNTTFFHDVVVQRVRGTWTMLLSYWDAGWILLDVDDPANPVFLDDSEFRDPDPLTGFSPPEGNAHQAEWNKTKRWIIGTSEDFGPFRPFLGVGDQRFDANQGTGSLPLTDDNPLAGPTVFVGDACDPATVPAAPGPGTIALIERGTCTFQAKTDAAVAKGYVAVVVFQNVRPDCAELVNPLVDTTVPFLFVNRAAGFAVLGQDPGADICTTATAATPGTAGADGRLFAEFDGWGYVHLLDARTLEETDAYAIPEALDPAFAEGFGDLSVHEVATDPDHPHLAYLSYYAGGFRVIKVGNKGITEVGRFIDEGGNNFWGVEVHILPGKGSKQDRKLVLASDRDAGLYIFRYTGKH
jgi:hypothetical protein